MIKTEKDLQETDQLHQGIQQPQALYYQMPPSEDEIDLFELFSSLFLQWKLIVAITITGALLSILVALLIPKIYESSASVRQPLASQIAAINENGYTKFSAQQLFKRYYDQVKSKENLKEYLIKSDSLPKLVPKISEAEIDKAIVSFLKDLNTTILEPEVPKGGVVEFPELFQISLSSSNEPETVVVLNSYLQHIEDMMIKKIRDEGAVEVALRSHNINRDIDLLRSNTKRSRELLIEKLTIENQEKINSLQQQIELLVTKAGSQRVNKIKNITEARDTAKSLKIEYPTTLEILAQSQSAVANNASTQINITSSTKLDFLMGTQYLDSQIILLQSRENDLPYIIEIPELHRKISAIKNDTRIAALKARESDEPFINSLPGKLNELNRLSHINFNFDSARLYQIDQAAAVDGMAEKPNRKLIAVLGTLLSGMLALFIALIVATARKRGLRKED